MSIVPYKEGREGCRILDKRDKAAHEICGRADTTPKLPNHSVSLNSLFQETDRRRVQDGQGFDIGFRSLVGMRSESIWLVRVGSRGSDCNIKATVNSRAPFEYLLELPPLLPAPE